VTTIVGAAVDGTVWMAADSMTNVYDRPVFAGARKIVRVRTMWAEMLVGVAGDAGTGQLLETLDWPEPTHDVPFPTPQQANAYATAVARVITRGAIQHGLTTDQGRLASDVLFGWAGQLWTLSHMCSIPHSDGVGAIGTGEGPAIGALDAFIAAGVVMPDAVARACSIGILRDRYSGGPVQLERLTGMGELDELKPAAA
jgi:ATP-dependent protease HslVU (ClpYQ) peptidase subunit